MHEMTDQRQPHLSRQVGELKPSEAFAHLLSTVNPVSTWHVDGAIHKVARRTAPVSVAQRQNVGRRILLDSTLYSSRQRHSPKSVSWNPGSSLHARRRDIYMSDASEDSISETGKQEIDENVQPASDEDSTVSSPVKEVASVPDSAASKPNPVVGLVFLLAAIFVIGWLINFAWSPASPFLEMKAPPPPPSAEVSEALAKLKERS